MALPSQFQRLPHRNFQPESQITDPHRWPLAVVPADEPYRGRGLAIGNPLKPQIRARSLTPPSLYSRLLRQGLIRRISCFPRRRVNSAPLRLPKAPQPWDLELCWDSASNASYQTLSQATKAACNTRGA